MKRNKNKIHLYLVLISGLVLLVGVGYALLTSNLNISGTTTINKASWDIHFENLRVTEGSVTATNPAEIDANKTTVNFGVTLTNPGDYYEFSVDEVNKGTIDAMVSSIAKTGVTEEQAKYLDYNVTYDSGAIVSEKQLLAANETEKIKVRVEFKKDITASDLPTTSQILNLSFSLNYTQADSSAVAVGHPVCRRATTLHTEICNQSSASFGCRHQGYNLEDIITYGNLGTKGTLVSGDAFDCDVNGDGVYDSKTERFYYVSDLDTNNDYAVLIYYNNVSEGIPNNTATSAYDISNKPREFGPVSAILHLPTIQQWKNMNLVLTVRVIRDEVGTGYIDFIYEGYVSRLLAVEELNAGCGKGVKGSRGELDICNYLMENTNYAQNSLTLGYWLEAVSSVDETVAKVVDSYYRNFNGTHAFYTNRYGVRPVVEVEKTKISY